MLIDYIKQFTIDSSAKKRQNKFAKTKKLTCFIFLTPYLKKDPHPPLCFAVAPNKFIWDFLFSAKFSFFK